MKRLLSLFLLIAMLLALTVPGAAAGPAEVTGGSLINPRYRDFGPPSAAGALSADEDAPLSEFPEARAPLEAAAVLRQAMVDRIPSIRLNITVENYWAVSGSDSWFTLDFFPLVCSPELGDSPYEGDYLQWSWYRYQWSVVRREGRDVLFEIDMEYYTDASQEAWVRSSVDALTAELALREKDPADAYAAVYDYVAGHVRYDRAGLATHSDSDPDNDDFYIFTAFGALRNGKAVCQGYAMLYYALCRNADLPVRIITSTTHAWNIVRLREIWYCLDVTWDSESGNGREWFLLGTDRFTFGQHTPEAEYLTDSFQAAYPISRWDYDPLIPYRDVPRTNGHYDTIRRATGLGLLNGTSPVTFSPASDVQRAMLVTVLWRMDGSPEPEGPAAYEDVAETAYYAKPVAWASEAGIVLGVGENRFDPESPATREQLVTILHRYAGYLEDPCEESALLTGFTDLDMLSPWAEDAMAWAVATGIVHGTSPETLSPRANTPREQLATLMVRMWDRYRG